MTIHELVSGFIESVKGEIAEASMNGKSYSIDFLELDKYSPELGDELLDNPDYIIELLNDAVIELGLPNSPSIGVKNLNKASKVSLRDLRVKHIGKLVSVEGIVKLASEVLPKVYELSCECLECGNVFDVPQEGNFIKTPKMCPNCGRNDIQISHKKRYDCRWLAIQEPYDSDTRPGETRVFLKKSLTDSEFQNQSDPGNRITVVGIVREMTKSQNRVESTQEEYFIEALYIESQDRDIDDLNLSPKDIAEIELLAQSPTLLPTLVGSFAPSIYGNEQVKEALLLQAVGGVSTIRPDGTRVRGNLNVLLIGDPATSKTQLLKATTSLIPRARYVSGTGATSAGLIASVRRDEFTGGWVLEAGAVVLCNRSLLAVDEFEKLNKPDQVALHEVMESNSVSISKAGINATLPAHTSILAGANPKLGRFDSFMSISEQIDITPTLLSRFDVRFVLRDEPDEAKDSAIIDHIINTRLGESTPIVPPEFLVKYLLYAKRKVSEVTLTKEVLQAIKDYYTSSRKSYCMENKTLPLTLRQFEGMVRLSQAYAKLHLRTQTTLEDASNAIKLMEYSLKNLGFDPESGQIDIDRLESTTTSTQRSRTDCVLAIYNVLSSQGDVYIDDLISACESKGIPNPNKTIEEMLKRCIFYSPRSGLIEVV